MLNIGELRVLMDQYTINNSTRKGIITRFLLNSQIILNQFLFVFCSNWTKKDKQKRNISKNTNYNFFAGDFWLWLAILKTTLTSIHAVNLKRLIKYVDFNIHPSMVAKWSKTLVQIQATIGPVQTQVQCTL